MELSVKNEDYLIELAESGQEALEIAEELVQEGNSLTVIISDYVMPAMKGDELLIKLHKQFPLAKKILLTGQAAIEGVTNAINGAGLYRFIQKPWDRDDLRLTVQEAIRKFKADQKLDEQEKLITKLNEAIGDRGKGVDDRGDIESILYERELYDQLFFIRYYQSLDDKIQEWLSKAAIGIICADHKISRSEKLFFEAIVKYDRDKERVLRYIDMIKGNVQPKLETMRVDEETAFHLLDNLAWILVSNQTIKVAEEKYFEFVCSTIGVDDKIASGFLNMAKTRINSNQIRSQTQAQIQEATLVYQPEMQPLTFVMKQQGSKSKALASAKKQSGQQSAGSKGDGAHISRSAHNNAVKIRQFTCFVCGSEDTIQYNVLEPKSQKPETNIFGIPSYKAANKGFNFVDFNMVKLAVCPSCYYASANKEDFRRRPVDEAPKYLSNKAFNTYWIGTIFDRQEKLLNFNMAEYYDLHPSLELVEVLYDIRIQAIEKGCELSKEDSIRWEAVTTKLTLAEILSGRGREDRVNQLLKECVEQSREVFEKSAELTYTYKAGRVLFYLALYFEDKKIYGEMIDYFSRSVRENNEPSTEDGKLLKKIAKELRRSFDDREDYAKKALDGLHLKTLDGKDAAPQVAGLIVQIEQ